MTNLKLLGATQKPKTRRIRESMRIKKVPGGLELTGEELELDLIHEAFRARPGVRVGWVVIQESSPVESEESRIPIPGSALPSPSDAVAVTIYLKEDPGAEAALRRFIKVKPFGTPNDFMQFLFNGIPPKFSSKGPYERAYNSVYARLKTLRVKEGHRSTIREWPRTRPGARPGRRARNSEAQGLGRPVEERPDHFPTSAEARSMIIQLAREGVPITVHELSRRLAGESGAANVLLRRRVSAYWSRLRPLTATELGGEWQDSPSRKGEAGHRWKIVVGGSR